MLAAKSAQGSKPLKPSKTLYKSKKLLYVIADIACAKFAKCDDFSFVFEFYV